MTGPQKNGYSENWVFLTNLLLRYTFRPLRNVYDEHEAEDLRKVIKEEKLREILEADKV